MDVPQTVIEVADDPVDERFLVQFVNGFSRSTSYRQRNQRSLLLSRLASDEGRS